MQNLQPATLSSQNQPMDTLHVSNLYIGFTYFYTYKTDAGIYTRTQVFHQGLHAKLVLLHNFHNVIRAGLCIVFLYLICAESLFRLSAISSAQRVANPI